MKYVIIGNGVCGVHAAEMIRQLDAKGQIVMIGDETFHPYCRPMISMVLEGSATPNQLPIRNAAFYDRLNIEPVLGNRVVHINVDNKTVSIENGQTVSFDKLLIAAGADPRSIRAEGSDLNNIFFMRTEAHVRQMVSLLPSVKNALVLGGGLVGFKAAYSLMKRGIPVTMLIRSGYPLSMQVDEIAGKLILDKLVAQGLTVEVGLEVRAFEGNGQVKRAFLSDGSPRDCDMVVVGKGVLPATSFVPKDQICVDAGILVNSRMETNIPGIFAGGDVAQSMDITRKSPWINAIWPEAVIQGRIAGMNMAGRAVEHKGSLSRNVIRMFDMDVMTGGIVNPPDDPAFDTLSCLNPKQKTYRKLVFRHDTLVGMVLIDAIEQGGVLLSLIQNEIPIRISKERLIDNSFNYKQLLFK